MPEDVWGVGHNIDRCSFAVPPANLVSRLLVGAEKKIARYLLFAHAKNLDPPKRPPARYFEIFGPPVQIFRNIWTPIELIFQELDDSQ